MIGFKLTPEEAASINGKMFNKNTAFNPVPDINGDMYIFEGENGDFIEFEDFFWIRDLNPSEFVPPINNETII